MESKLFTLDDDELLIDLVSERPVIYDFSNEHYKDRAVKTRAWNDVAKLVRKDVAQCQARWKTIRDTHRRNLKKVKRASPTATPPFAKTKYTSKALQFLDSTFLQQRNAWTKVSGSLDDTNELSLSESQHSEETERLQAQVKSEPVECDVQVMSSDDEDEEEAGTSYEASPEIRNFQKGVSNLSHLTRQQRANAVASQKRLSKVDTRSSSQSSEIAVSMFFGSMSETVQKLPPDLIAEARLKICQVVTELELQALRRHRGPPPPRMD